MRISSNQKVSDCYRDVSDFEQLLADAESQAKSEWDQDFVGDLQQRYEQYGHQMFISQRQIEILERIVG